jgi:hypothetical protein
MYTLTVEPFTTGQFEKGTNNIQTDLCGTRISGNSKSISATGYVDVEAAFNLPQVLIKLAAKIGQAVVIGGFQDDVLRYLYGIQCGGVRPLKMAIASFPASLPRRLAAGNTSVHN